MIESLRRTLARLRNRFSRYRMAELSEDVFWEIVERWRRTAPENGTAGESEALAALSVPELRSVVEMASDVSMRTFSWRHLLAAWMFGGGGCGDDGFSAFRKRLLELGREGFERAVQDVEALADIDFKRALDSRFCDALVGTLKRKLTRPLEMYDLGRTGPRAVLAGEPLPLTVEGVKEHLPRLFAKRWQGLDPERAIVGEVPPVTRR